MSGTVWIVMGISGCGKSTIGKQLADCFDLQFLDADDFHPASNIEKMANGIPLTDADREPWLENLAQVIAQQHRITYDSAISTESLVKEICNLKQMYTQVGGARPFGVSIMFMGAGDGHHLFITDPTGTFFEYKASAIGEAETQVKETLDKEYKDNLTLDQGLKLAMKALKKGLGNDFNLDRIEGAYIKSDDKIFRRFTNEELSKASK